MNNFQNVNGDNNKVTNKQFQFFNHNQPPEFTSYDKAPVILFKKQVKTFWFLIGAAVSFAANLATLYTSLKDFGNFHSISTAYFSFAYTTLPGIVSLLCVYFYHLFREGHLFKFRGISISSYQGSLFFEKYKGTCPCGGKLRFFQNLYTGQGYAQCMASDSHIFQFSPKVFDEENYATA